METSIENDSSLLYGEVSASPLQTIEKMLSAQYCPLFGVCKDWGKVNDEQKADFNGEMNRLKENIGAALESLSGGLGLRVSDHKQMESYDRTNIRNFLQSAVDSPDFIPHLENLLEEWCQQIEEYLICSQEKGEDMTISSNKKPHVIDRGPKGELEYWRIRMQRLASITEQHKRRHCANAVHILTEVSKGAGDQSKAKIIILLRRWKQIDVTITEAANEAKDNVKYLKTLLKFLDAFYSGTPQSMIDSIPALLNSIKVRLPINLNMSIPLLLLTI